MNSTLQVGLNVTFRHFLDARVRMQCGPLVSLDIVFQRTVLCRAMAGLANEPQLESRTLIAGNRNPNRVELAVDRQARTFHGVSQIAKFVQLMFRRLSTLVARCGAAAMPSSSQR
jgi:hypothetical protein